jgi:hypothetical protein
MGLGLIKLTFLILSSLFRRGGVLPASADPSPVRPWWDREVGAGVGVEKVHMVFFKEERSHLAHVRIVSSTHPSDNPMRSA